MKKTVLMMMLVLTAASLFAGGKKETGSSGAYTIEASGSTSVAPLMETLAENQCQRNRLGRRHYRRQYRGSRAWHVKPQSEKL
jgi:ABC-type phosphate transport system substrate-binding protein